MNYGAELTMVQIRSDYLHIIVTRYNVGLYRKTDIYDPEEWMHYRLPLFHDYCLKSIMGQTCQDFVWLVLFDSETPVEWRNKILPLLSGSNIVPIFLDVRHCNTRVLITKTILDLVPKAIKYLITQHHDNDDFLACDYVEVAHGAMQDKKTPYVLDVSMIDVIKEIEMVYQVTMPKQRLGYATPFCLVVEDREAALTCMCVPHHKLCQKFSKCHTVNRLRAGRVNHEMNLSRINRGHSRRYNGDGVPISSDIRTQLVERFGINTGRIQ